ncbi:MAG: galactose-1-phosphate uridylyltransferase [Actinobacteria bacterium]|nr:galactose-1-phosphate uridylyltransferase [Actinomycetota bacterium]
MKQQLPGGVTRQNLKLSDGRDIYYYDTKDIDRNAVDSRADQAQPGIGHLRLDLLVNEWVVVASHRQHRVFLPPKELCPLCASTKEKQTEIPDSDYEVAVFTNRAPALTVPNPNWKLPQINGVETPNPDAAGACEVVCYTSDHGTSFAKLPIKQIRAVLEAWKNRDAELSKLPYIQHIFPFENRGEEVGVTISHPHGQIYAYSFIPPRVERMLSAAQDYLKQTGRVLLDDLIKREIKDEKRIIAQNSEWIAYVPFAARYPFEIHLAPLRSVARMSQLDEKQSETFPEIAKEILTRLDGVFGIEMAYIASWYQSPVNVGSDCMRLHWQIVSVRRQPGKLKYLSGSESAMGAFIMDLEPEQSADQLRQVKI